MMWPGSTFLASYRERLVLQRHWGSHQHNGDGQVENFQWEMAAEGLRVFAWAKVNVLKHKHLSFKLEDV